MFKIATLIFSIVGTTLAGIIITAMLTVPGLVDGKPLLIVVGAAGGYGLAIPASLIIANLVRKSGGLSA